LPKRIFAARSALISARNSRLHRPHILKRRVECLFLGDLWSFPARSLVRVIGLRRVHRLSDVNAFRAIADRVEGKPRIAVDLSSNRGFGIPPMMLEECDKQIFELLEKGRQRAELAAGEKSTKPQ